ncbi:MAG: type II toxin-antitoxin system Phd/YefM family antitoxin [Methylococcaceae bacterium]
MHRVNNQHDAFIVTHSNEKPIVIMSLEDYQGLSETAYLLRNEKGAKRLLNSVEKLRAGKGTIRELIDDN